MSGSAGLPVPRPLTGPRAVWTQSCRLTVTRGAAGGDSQGGFQRDSSCKAAATDPGAGGSCLPAQPAPSLPHRIRYKLCCVAVGPLPTPHPLEALSHAPLKQIKHLLFRFFFHFFFLFYKNMHTYTGYSGPGEDTRACTHTHSLLFFHSRTRARTHTHTHTHTHTQILSFVAPGLNPRSLEDSARVAPPPPCLPSTLPPTLPLAKLVLCRARVSWGPGDPRERRLMEGRGG